MSYYCKPARKREDKKVTLLKHTTRRLAERYDLTLKPDEVRFLANCCRRNRYVVYRLERQSWARSLLVVRYGETLLPLIYDHRRHCIITALTMGMLTAEEQKEVNKAHAKAEIKRQRREKQMQDIAKKMQKKQKLTKDALQSARKTPQPQTQKESSL